MGLVDKAASMDSWQNFRLTETPGFNLVMPRNRFQLILTFLYFTYDYNWTRLGEPGYDNIFKLRPIIDELLPKCASLLKPAKELSLDEMTIAFKWRSTL